VFKKGDLSQPSNYRSISLLSSFDRLLPTAFANYFTINSAVHLYNTRYA